MDGKRAGRRRGNRSPPLSRRTFLGATAGAVAALAGAGRGAAENRQGWPAIDATFIFTADIHACRMTSGIPPICVAEGKTDRNLLRHIAAINRIPEREWPLTVGGVASKLSGAGQKMDAPLGIVIGGDMTDDGGGQVTLPSEGTQLLQFSQRYQQGTGPDRVHFPVYAGLGNHDLDQNGPKYHLDWYRRELRDYIELNHRPSVFFKALVPAGNYDVLSDDYSWDWGGLHLVQMQRFGGDTRHGAISGLPWLKQDLAYKAADGRPVILFQHYGWDDFSTERWDPLRRTFDAAGTGPARWWSGAEREALLDLLAGYNVIGLFHGHEHADAMIYRRAGIDMFKPKAAFLGGFAVVHVTNDFMDVVLAEATGEEGEVAFTNAFSKRLDQREL